jgi:hypothetical protein
MEVYTLDNLSLREIKALRKSLDHIPITGIDAIFIAQLQVKLNKDIQQIEEHLQSPPEPTPKRGRPRDD